MLLAIDAGNSEVKLGLFQGSTLLEKWRLVRDNVRFRNEYHTHVEKLFDGSKFSAQDVEAIIISSVIARSSTLKWLAEDFFKVTPVFVDHTMRTGLTILYDDPSKLGTDRIVDSVAAVEKYGAPCIVVDFGTATTFNAISSAREFLGGIIVPGIMTAFNALIARTANLEEVSFSCPLHVIGTSTYGALQSGLFFGTIDMVDALIKRIREEMGGSPKVIATGGLAGWLELRSEYIEEFDENLTLDGLRIIYEMNKA
jgi:type III pantothenate kinase